MNIEIKKGDKLRCFKNVIHIDEYGNDYIRYYKGKLYECHKDNCITNEHGDDEYLGLWEEEVLNNNFEFVYKLPNGINEDIFKTTTITCNSELPLQDKEEVIIKNTDSDSKVNHPSHYNYLKELCGIEVIDITRHMDFDLGNAVKYILRCGHKSEKGYSDKAKTIEDIKKAIWYLNDKLKMLNEEK